MKAQQRLVALGIAVFFGLAACGNEEPEVDVDEGAGVEATGTLEEAVIPDSLQGVAPAAPSAAPK